ncbi:MAG: DUF1893 domain-containing protein [Candidatus Aenigmarchaeota archaeon]|nr:DUF1893 domain-containing protein [Candidatus Aenigmarchaeota archaeon]
MKTSSRYSLVVEKNGKVIFKSKEQKLLPLVKCIKELDISGAKVFDKIVGVAAARLLAYAGVKEVHAGIASKKAAEIFKNNGIKINATEIVDHILSDTGNICKFEKLSMKFRSNEKFFKELVRMFEL